jgi:hypothetical protein
MSWPFEIDCCHDQPRWGEYSQSEHYSRTTKRRLRSWNLVRYCLFAVRLRCVQIRFQFQLQVFPHFYIFKYLSLHFWKLFEFRGKSESSGFERLGFISLFVIAIVCGVAQIIIAGITLNDIKILQDCIQQHSCPCNAVLGGFFCKYLSSHVQVSSLTRFT